jgi:hypothetical protein
MDADQGIFALRRLNLSAVSTSLRRSACSAVASQVKRRHRVASGNFQAEINSIIYPPVAAQLLD